MKQIHHAIQSLNEKNNNTYDATVEYPISNETEYLEKCKYVTGEDENGNAIFSETPLYTWAEVSAELTLLTNEYNSKQYSRDRREAYGSFEAQLDMLYWDKKNGTNTWVEFIDQIKTDIPKE
jgi:Fe-S cluster biosynthesis and repair protein YggX